MFKKVNSYLPKSDVNSHSILVILFTTSTCDNNIDFNKKDNEDV